MRWVALSLCFLVGCAAPTEIVAENEEAIVGGEIETTATYDAAGYVLDVDAHTKSPSCSAVLVAADIAVTSGSCVDPEVSYAAGFRSGLYRVVEVIRHPSFSTTNNDLAVLRLVRAVDGVTPATIGTVSAAGCGFRAVGYGQESAEPHSKSGERKSMAFCVDEVAATELKGKSADGASCTGDNGGPLMVTGSSNTVVGLLSRRGDNTPACTTGGKLVMTKLSSHKAFLDPFILGL